MKQQNSSSPKWAAKMVKLVIDALAEDNEEARKAITLKIANMVSEIEVAAFQRGILHQEEVSQTEIDLLKEQIRVLNSKLKTKEKEPIQQRQSTNPPKKTVPVAKPKTKAKPKSKPAVKPKAKTKPKPPAKVKPMRAKGRGKKVKAPTKKATKQKKGVRRVNRR